jgi:hypothetical protein
MDKGDKGGRGGGCWWGEHSDITFDLLTVEFRPLF